MPDVSGTAQRIGLAAALARRRTARISGIFERFGNAARVADRPIHPRNRTKHPLKMRAGEIFGLLGPNAAGQTTTVGMLITRVVPTAGRAFVGEVDVVTCPALAKQLLGVVSQQYTLDRQLTVWENPYFHGLLFMPSAERAGCVCLTGSSLLDRVV